MHWWTKTILITQLSVCCSCVSHYPAQADNPEPHPEQSWSAFIYGSGESHDLMDALKQQADTSFQMGLTDFELYTRHPLPAWLDSLFQLGYSAKTDKGYHVYRPKDHAQRFKRIEFQPHPEKKEWTLIFDPSVEFYRTSRQND